MSLCYDCNQLSDNKQDNRFINEKGPLIECDRCEETKPQWVLRWIG